MIHAHIEKHLNSDFDTITLIDKSNKDNIIGVFYTHNAIVNGFDKAFFYIRTDNGGMLYFDSFIITREQEDGTKLEVERECKPKQM